MYNYLYLNHSLCLKKKDLICSILYYFSQTFPFFGVVPELLTEDGKVIEGEGEGYLVCCFLTLLNY